MEDWETQRYKGAIQLYQVHSVSLLGLMIAKVEEWKTSASLAFLNLVQTGVLNGALLTLALYCAHLVRHHKTFPTLNAETKVAEKNVLTVGDFVLLGTYFMQVCAFGPLGSPNLCCS
jgi:hypothetical protein